MPEKTDHRTLEFQDYINLRNISWLATLTAVVASWRIIGESMKFELKVASVVGIGLAFFLPGLLNWKKARGIIEQIKKE